MSEGDKVSMETTQTISVITPMFNEEQNVSLFHSEISKVLHKLPFHFEIIFVDDGSSDASVQEAVKLAHEKNVSVKVVQLSKNFGKEIAVTAGMHHAEGDAALIIDIDLQHPVEKIPEFITRWLEGAEVVIGVRKTHSHEGMVKKWGSTLFYQIMNKISDVEIVPHSTDYRLLDAQVIEEFKKFTERSRMTRGLIDWLGFDRDYVHFDANERQYGQATYSIKKLFMLAFNSFASHSMFPLRVAGYLGALLTFCAGAFGVFIIIENYIMADPLGLAISNVVMLATLTLFMVGIMMSCLGLIAFYIGNIHSEVSNRPLYVLRPNRRSLEMPGQKKRAPHAALSDPVIAEVRKKRASVAAASKTKNGANKKSASQTAKERKKAAANAA